MLFTMNTDLIYVLLILFLSCTSRLIQK